MSEPSSRFAAFIAELKHRRVFRVAVVYAGVAFIIIQIIDGAFDYLRIPEWVGTTIIVLLALGFPIAVGMAWAFDLTAEGLVRARESKRDQPKKPHHVIIGNKTLAVIAALAIIAAAWSWLREPSPGGAPITSIAVLPLDNLMGDPEQEYFVEGMHEAIITNLARLSALTVISRTSAMRYKDTDKLMPEIALELNVDAIVEGSVLEAGNRVRIAVQLTHGASDEHLWANDYEGNLTNILYLQKTVAGAIAKEIGLALTPVDEAYLASAPQVDPEAYNLYLKGLHFRNLETKESMPKAVEYLQQSVALDLGFARAWAALSISYFMMRGLRIWNRDYAGNRMKHALDKALELDPNQADAYAYMGIYQHLWKRDVAWAKAAFRRALELDPDNVYTRYEYGLFLYRTGWPDEALEQYRRAQELDPLNPTLYDGFNLFYNYTRQYEKHLENRLLQQELQGRPRDNSSIERSILMQQGRYAEAAAEAEKAWDLFQQLRAEWALGNREKVYSVRDSLRATGELQQWEREEPFWSAQFYAIMDEREMALGLLERAYENTTISWEGLVYFPEFDSLRGEPRFKALLEKIGLTEVFDQNGQRIR